MRKACWLVCCAVLAICGVARAQDVVGDWQGKLPIEKNSRIVLKFARECAALHGWFVRVDQYADTFPFNAVSLVGQELRFAAPYLETSFQGTLSADGKSIGGTWTQAGKSYPVTFAAVAADAVWKFEKSGQDKPMVATADPAFEVATIRPSAPGGGGLRFVQRNRRFEAHNASVGSLVRYAYRLRDRVIEGAPAWFNEARFDVVAEPDVDGVPSEDQSRVMVRKLLADRFQMKSHVIQKTFPIYALTVSKNAPKITQSAKTNYEHGHIVTRQTPDGDMMAQFLNTSMREFADLLSGFIPDRQVVDETGLKGDYDFTLTVPMWAVQGGPSGGEATSPADAIVHATQVQLGLGLVRKERPLDVLVIDGLEKPSEN